MGSVATAATLGLLLGSGLVVLGVWLVALSWIMGDDSKGSR